MEIKENKEFLLATRLTRLTDFLVSVEEKTMFRNAIYDAIIWGKQH